MSKRAQQLDETMLVGYIEAAAEGDWRAAAWLLERGFPTRWARRTGGPSKTTEPSPESTDLFAEVDELARRRASRD
jgi:hypothetical protein